MTLQFVSSERLQQIRQNFNRRYGDAVAGRHHLWTATVSYFVTPPLTEGSILDVENMAMDPAVGCYVCEQIYSPSLAARPCAGEPS